MSQLFQRVQGGAILGGGALGYPSEQLHEEVACIAFHFHWSLEEILQLNHRARWGWVSEIDKLKAR